MRPDKVFMKLLKALWDLIGGAKAPAGAPFPPAAARDACGAGLGGRPACRAFSDGGDLLVIFSDRKIIKEKDFMIVFLEIYLLIKIQSISLKLHRLEKIFHL